MRVKQPSNSINLVISIFFNIYNIILYFIYVYNFTCKSKTEEIYGTEKYEMLNRIRMMKTTILNRSKDPYMKLDTQLGNSDLTL